MTQTANMAPNKLRFQGAANRIVRALLRTPLICRAVGSRLVTIYVVGRTSGTRYNIPTAYAQEGSTLLIGTSFRWARNLRTGEPIDIRLRGTRRTAEVEVVSDEVGVVACYDTIVRGNHQFAKFNNIRLDAAGNPNQADLHQAWAAGARAIRLTPVDAGPWARPKRSFVQLGLGSPDTDCSAGHARDGALPDRRRSGFQAGNAED